MQTKTLLLVSSYQLELCDFSFKYQSGVRIRIVLLEHAERLERVPPQVREHIDHFHLCEKEEPDSPLSGLSYSSAAAAIQAERSQRPSDEYHLYTFFEFDTYLVSRLREAFEIPGAGPERILPFRDKKVMKQRVLEAGLRAPRFELLDVGRLESEVDSYFSELRRSYGLPFVCKPINAAASIGVLIVRSLEDFRSLRGHVQRFDYVFELEEFIQGTLYHCDFLLRGHEIVFSGCGEYFFPNAEATRGKLIGSIILPSHHPDALALTSFGGRCLAALGLRDGAAHMEVFKSHSGERVFLEVGARPPGLDVCCAYEDATGVNLITLALKIELGLEFSVPRPARRSALWGHIPVRLGEVVDVARPVTRERLKLSLSVQRGNVLESSFSYLRTMGKFSAHSGDFESLQRDFRHLKHFPFVTLKEDRLSRRQINVIGAGLVGTSCVIQLLDRILERRLDNVDINIFERAERFGPGFAFSSTSDSSLSNTRAGMMSLLPQDYSHFIAWSRANQERLADEFGALFPIAEDSYVPRRLFGIYLEDELASARVRAERAGVVLRFIPSEVVDIHVSPEASVLETAEGERYHATDVVFALGNQPTQSFTHLERHEGYFSSPYPEHLLRERIDRNARVLVVGSRLSAIDAVLVLASAGHRNRITVASREGLFPAVRGYMDKYHTALNPEAVLERIRDRGQPPLQAYFQALHLALEEVYGRPLPDDFLEPSSEDGRSELQRVFEQTQGDLAHWQKLAVSMIECMETIWPFLSHEERESFLESDYKKLFRYIAALPVVNARRLLELFTCRRLEIQARLQSVTHDERSGRFIATYESRSPESFDVVINATGTGPSLLKSRWPLVPTLGKRDIFEFNAFEHFSVHRETLRVRTKSPVSARFYAPATCCRGEFAITNFIDICIEHARLVVDDLLGPRDR